MPSPTCTAFRSVRALLVRRTTRPSCTGSPPNCPPARHCRMPTLKVTMSCPENPLPRAGRPCAARLLPGGIRGEGHGPRAARHELAALGTAIPQRHVRLAARDVQPPGARQDLDADLRMALLH